MYGHSHESACFLRHCASSERILGIFSNINVARQFYSTALVDNIRSDFGIWKSEKSVPSFLRLYLVQIKLPSRFGTYLEYIGEENGLESGCNENRKLGFSYLG
jgi:hypothetical protein